MEANGLLSACFFLIRSMILGSGITLLIVCLYFYIVTSGNKDIADKDVSNKTKA
jgi:hypothetical protein